MRHRLRGAAALLLGALLLGTAGLSLGSWYGGRGAEPLHPDRVHTIAAELLPGAEPISIEYARGSVYAVTLAPDDFGYGRVRLLYDDHTGCAHSDEFERNATSLGLQDLERVPGDLCDGWRVEANDLLITFAQDVTGPTLSFKSAAPDAFLAYTIIGAVLGAAAGAALFGLVGRRRTPVPELVQTLVTVGLLPGVALTWAGLYWRGLTEPVWPLWQLIDWLLVPLWIFLLAAGLITYAVQRRRTGHLATEPTPAVGATSPATGSGGH